MNESHFCYDEYEFDSRCLEAGAKVQFGGVVLLVKVWVGRHRRDLLAVCGSVPVVVHVGEAVCRCRHAVESCVDVLSWCFMSSCLDVVDLVPGLFVGCWRLHV